jgi:aspartate/methionine/tyrosine aminotransferase
LFRAERRVLRISFGCRNRLTGDEFAEQLLMEKRVAVVPGSAFGAGGADHVRIAYCKSYEQIEIALEKIKDFVESLRVSSEEAVATRYQ